MLGEWFQKRAVNKAQDNRTRAIAWVNQSQKISADEKDAYVAGIYTLTPAEPDHYRDFLTAYLKNKQGRIGALHLAHLGNEFFYAAQSIKLPKAENISHALTVIAAPEADIVRPNGWSENEYDMRISDGVISHGNNRSVLTQDGIQTTPQVPLFSKIAESMIKRGWRFQRDQFEPLTCKEILSPRKPLFQRIGTDEEWGKAWAPVRAQLTA